MKKILVIDNDKEFRHMLAEVLTMRNYQVILTADGYNGVIQAGKNKPDVILMDIKMPSMNGLDVLDKLKSHVETASIPVIAISGIASGEQIEQTKAEGAFLFLPKPLSLSALFEAIEKALASTA